MKSWGHLARTVLVICWKNIKIYYAKGPIVVTGILFPVFLWLAFQTGKGLKAEEAIPSLIAVTLFSTSSSITPVIAPWETRQKTLEMLLARPVTIARVLAGDMLASTIFGFAFALPPVIYGLAYGVAPASPLLLMGLLILASLEFSALGVLFSAVPTDTPADAVMISSVVKLPLIFISGVFTPVNQMPSWIKPISTASPLTYVADAIRLLYKGEDLFTAVLDLLVTMVYTAIFVLAAVKLHRKTITARLQLR